MKQRAKDSLDGRDIDEEFRNLHNLSDEELMKKLGELMPRAIMKDDQLWPLVKFTNGHFVLCIVETFEVTDASRRALALRQQVRFMRTLCLPECLNFDKVPLILAWAMTIHKSQGQTIERVKVDMKRIFEKGQGKLS